MFSFLLTHQLSATINFIEECMGMQCGVQCLSLYVRKLSFWLRARLLCYQSVI